MNIKDNLTISFGKKPFNIKELKIKKLFRSNYTNYACSTFSKGEHYIRVEQQKSAEDRCEAPRRRRFSGSLRCERTKITFICVSNWKCHWKRE